MQFAPQTKICHVTRKKQSTFTIILQAAVELLFQFFSLQDIIKLLYIFLDRILVIVEHGELVTCAMNVSSSVHIRKLYWICSICSDWVLFYLIFVLCVYSTTKNEILLQYLNIFHFMNTEGIKLSALFITFCQGIWYAVNLILIQTFL